MRYYLKTTNSTLVGSYRELAETEKTRHVHVLRFARKWGFDEIGINGFDEKIAFFKKLTDNQRGLRTGPSIEGFRACRDNPIEWYKGEKYFRYYFHGRSKTANLLKKKLLEKMPPAPKELMARHARRTVDAAFCIRHQLPDGHFAGHRILFSLVGLLRGDILVMSLPVTGEDVVIPEGCEEITERAWGAEIENHNQAVEEPHHDNQ